MEVDDSSELVDDSCGDLAALRFFLDRRLLRRQTSSSLAVLALLALPAPLLALAASVHAQSLENTVQWRVEDGGNGHWYRWIEEEPTEELWTASASPALL